MSPKLQPLLITSQFLSRGRGTSAPFQPAWQKLRCCLPGPPGCQLAFSRLIASLGPGEQKRPFPVPSALSACPGWHTRRLRASTNIKQTSGVPHCPHNPGTTVFERTLTQTTDLLAFYLHTLTYQLKRAEEVGRGKNV